jgi:hypothetical protein
MLRTSNVWSVGPVKEYSIVLLFVTQALQDPPLCCITESFVWESYDIFKQINPPTEHQPASCTFPPFCNYKVCKINQSLWGKIVHLNFLCQLSASLLSIVIPFLDHLIQKVWCLSPTFVSMYVYLCTREFLYVRYSFLLSSNKFCDLSLLHWPPHCSAIRRIYYTAPPPPPPPPPVMSLESPPHPREK